MRSRTAGIACGIALAAVVATGLRWAFKPSVTLFEPDLTKGVSVLSHEAGQLIEAGSDEPVRIKFERLEGLISLRGSDDAGGEDAFLVVRRGTTTLEFNWLIERINGVGRWASLARHMPTPQVRMTDGNGEPASRPVPAQDAVIEVEVPKNAPNYRGEVLAPGTYRAILRAKSFLSPPLHPQDFGGWTALCVFKLDVP